MTIDLREVPFSASGSYFAFAVVEDCFVLKDIHGGHETPSLLFKLQIDGFSNIYSSAFQQVYSLQVTETELAIFHRKDEQRWLRILVSETDGCRFFSKGIEVQWVADYHMYNTFFQLTEQQYEYISYKKDQHYLFTVLSGELQVDAAWQRIENRHILLKTSPETETDMVLGYSKVVSDFETAAGLSKSFQQQVDENQLQLADFREALCIIDTSRETALASYLLWSNQAAAEGQLTHRAVFMSKNWMQNIWSWDNCFSGLALAAADPELAYHQMSVFFDHQSPEGAFPDFINDKTISFSCVKPPIHGWAYQQMMNRNSFFSQEQVLQTVYKAIARNTDYWLTYRCHPQTGFFYYSHGNDSGWDNASVFHQGMPVATPDLLAFLAKQCRILSHWAEQVAPTEIVMWQERSQELRTMLLEQFYSAERQQFIARNARTGDIIEVFDSLLLQMPLFAEDLLPLNITQAIVQRLEAAFESPFGLRTEALESEYYQADGYWLGPIWPPVNYMLIHSLQQLGYQSFAKRLRDNYLLLTQTGGMAENYDAQTGQGNDDLGFAWASAVYLLLLKNEY